MLSFLLGIALADSPPPMSDGIEPAGVEAATDRTVDEFSRGSGVAVGFDSGFWSSQYGSGWKAAIPLHDQFGVRVRTLTLFRDTSPERGFDPTNMGSVEVFVRSPFFGERFRFVGGGGPILAIDGTHQPAVGIGGSGGIEGFVSRRVAFTIDVGGQTGFGAAGNGRGPRTSVGALIYLGKH